MHSFKSYDIRNKVIKNNLTYKAASPHHTDGSFVGLFVRTGGALPIKGKYKMLPCAQPSPHPKRLIGSAVFCAQGMQRPVGPNTLQWAAPFLPQNYPFAWGIWSASDQIHGSLGPPEIPNPRS